MSEIDELMTSLEDETFEAIFEGFLYTLDQPTLSKLEAEMGAREQEIADDMKRRLFNKAREYLQKTLAAK